VPARMKLRHARPPEIVFAEIHETAHLQISQKVGYSRTGRAARAEDGDGDHDAHRITPEAAMTSSAASRTFVFGIPPWPYFEDAASRLATCVETV
jgi:hypothetical protein